MRNVFHNISPVVFLLQDVFVSYVPVCFIRVCVCVVCTPSGLHMSCGPGVSMSTSALTSLMRWRRWQDSLDRVRGV